MKATGDRLLQFLVTSFFCFLLLLLVHLYDDLQMDLLFKMICGWCTPLVLSREDSLVLPIIVDYSGRLSGFGPVVFSSCLEEIFPHKNPVSLFVIFCSYIQIWQCVYSSLVRESNQGQRRFC